MNSVSTLLRRHGGYLRGGGALVAGLLLFTGAVGAQETSTRLLRQPDVSKTQIVFVYGGDLWSVARTGGSARRLTANPSIKRSPKFSPDGKYIAFTGNYDGNDDVYVIPAEGGEPKRLTFHPASDGVLGWTPDSKAILFRSARTSFIQRFTKLFTVPVEGGMERELPLPEGGLASFSPEGTKIAYNRIARENATWKRYRGGQQAYVSIYDLEKNAYSEVPHTDTTDFYPMWHKDKIYFASDRTSSVNLFSYDTKTRAVKQLTKFTEYDIKWPSLGPDAIVFEREGVISLFDLATEKVTPVPIQARSDLTAARPTVRRVENNIVSFGISPTGARAVFEARGDLFTVPAKKGETRDLTNTPGVREMNPAWSPDGKYIAYFSDKTGEYELYLRNQDGTGEETRLTSDGGTMRTGLEWSPDSKMLLYTDAKMRLWMIALADKKPVLVDSSEIANVSLGKWSPDSKWIAYTKAMPNRMESIYLYSLAIQKATQVSDGHYDDGQPVFDLSGKYLYFVSNRTFAPTIVGPEIGINFQNTSSLFALILAADTPSPLAPESDEEKPKEEAPKPDAAAPMPPMAAPRPAAPGVPEAVKIDLEGLYSRTVAFPLPPGQYGSLTGGRNKVFFVSGGTLQQFDLTSRAAAPILTGIGGYEMNPTATKVIYAAGGPGGAFYGITDVVPGQAAGAGRLNLALEMKTDPRAEWAQIYKEAWRYERDFYYDPNMRGLDWNAIGERYGKLLPSVAHRDDLTYLLGELVGELNTSHAYVQGAENPVVRQVNVGLLGVDVEAAGGYYRIQKIYMGENWNEARRSPLTDPGVKVKAGDYILAVNGTPLRATTNFYAPFEGTAGKTITLRVNDKPSEEGARTVSVRPVASEAGIRYLDWIEGNRRKVEAATGGRVAYFHVPSTSIDGISEFGRGFYSQTDKDAVIVDERFNSGGFIPTFFIEKLNRTLMSIGTPRYGADFKSPGEAIYGPKVILANEWAGSGGDAFPYFFKKAGLGPMIGKRTWGGLVGIQGFKPLLDGGGVTVPQFGLWSAQEGRWIAENYGVDPDIEVSNTPDLVNQGHDPQLERAIAYILDQLKKNPPKKYQHPPFPVEKR